MWKARCKESLELETCKNVKQRLLWFDYLQICLLYYPNTPRSSTVSKLQPEDVHRFAITRQTQWLAPSTHQLLWTDRSRLIPQTLKTLYIFTMAASRLHRHPSQYVLLTEGRRETPEHMNLRFNHWSTASSPRRTCIVD